MRTKVFLLAAAVFAVGASTSMAQVYSANAVGYVNITLVPGFQIIANPLDNTNNTISNLFTALPNGSRIYKFQANQTYLTASKAFGAWGANNGVVLDPGEGFFVQIPAGPNITVTFVGEVPQGNLSNPLLPGTFQIRSSQVPQALPLGRPNSANPANTLEFPANVGDRVFIFTAPNGPYVTHQFVQVPPVTGNRFWNTAGSQDGPTIQVASGFFLFKAAGSPNAWTRTFSVN